ncbi:MAG: universal stress protein, partial [Ginsengibacter sp.]
VNLINVVPFPVIVDDSILAPVMITHAEILEDNVQLMKTEVEKLSETYNGIKGAVEEGFVLGIISKWIDETRADLVVMGMKGKGRSISVFGSTTTAAIQKHSFPIFVIPEDAAFKSIDNITFASDFDEDIKLDRYAVLHEISEKFNSYINIVNVQKKNSSLNPEEAIGKMTASLAFSRQQHEFHTISDNRVEEGINKFIETNATDILAMVAHKHSLFDRMFGKVYTRTMSYQAKIPLLVL